MTSHSNDRLSAAAEPVEALLAKAPPRPAPDSDLTAQARTELHAEWQRVTGRRRAGRRIIGFAAAASVLLALALLVNFLDSANIPAVQVATIEKSDGPIYVLGEQSEFRETGNLSSIVAGQTIDTRGEAVVGLSWNSGGSLRVDEHSRVKFVSKDAIELLAGRIYFDSQPFASNAEAGVVPTLEIRTEHGIVTHIGTQYMTEVKAESLIVSVRDGRVNIEGTFRDAIAEKGKKVTLQGSRRPSITSTPTYGSEWQWAELASPIVTHGGHTGYKFLQWVAQETGLQPQYVDEPAEQLLLNETVKGELAGTPRDALRQWMEAMDLDYRIENGRILISSKGQ